MDLDFSTFNNIFNNVIKYKFKDINLTNAININVRSKIIHFENVYWKYINTKCFTNLRYLRMLSISKNNIRRIQNDTFKNLIRLSDLLLDFNNIIHIETGAFNGLSRLATLELSYNSIVELNTGTFTIYNKRVEYIYIKIRGNKLKTIKNGLFTFHYIKELDLSNNSITNIETNSFNTTILQILKLDNNMLSTIDERVFGNLNDKLNTFTIFNNKIECNCIKLNWVFDHVILTFLNSSVNEYIKCHKLEINLFNKINNCTNNKGKYIYIYIYIYIIYIYIYIYIIYIYIIYILL